MNEDTEKIFDVVIIFSDGHREHHDFATLKILEGCLMVVDPENVIPREVHCFPLTGIRSFIFDADAIAKHVNPESDHDEPKA